MRLKVKREEPASPFCCGKRKSSEDSRLLQKRYRTVKLDIAESKDEFRMRDSTKFYDVFNSLQKLHEKVDKPREQLADAEAFFCITTSLLEAIKESKRAQGPSATEFVSSTIRNYGLSCHMNTNLEHETAIEPVMDWKRLGCLAQSIFSDAPGLTTMIGPLEKEAKPRKLSQHRRRIQPSQTVTPQQLENNDIESTDATKNASEMFEILKRLKSVYLESLVLNRLSFAQTVENIFALSYLVKDGRVEICIRDGRCVVLGPRNFPNAQQRDKGLGSMHQFVFRFDFKDWQAMLKTVEPGEELMSHRSQQLNSEAPNFFNEVRKVSRNRAQEREQHDNPVVTKSWFTTGV